MKLAMLAGAMCTFGLSADPGLADPGCLETQCSEEFMQVSANQAVCELSYGALDSTTQGLYPHIVVFVFAPFVGGTQTGQAPTPTPRHYQEVYAFCAALL